MNRLISRVGLFVMLFGAPSVGLPLDTTILYSFGGGASDGASPRGDLILDGSTLYGTTVSGFSGAGSVFKINTDGTGYAVLASAGSAYLPAASLALLDSTLYGMSSHGVFAVNTDGSGLSLLTLKPTSGRGSLAVSGSTLYGMTNSGGTGSKGTVFKVNKDGSGYANIHSFTGGTTDGASPSSGVVVSGTTLYGMTTYGGTSNLGTIFRVNTDGTDYAVLRSFSGPPADGSKPQFGDLIANGSILYGMTFYGGDLGFGTVFSLNMDGGGFKVLHSFGNGDDGDHPYGGLSLSGSTLYGMTDGGGSYSNGTLFQLNTDGSDYTVLQSFMGSPNDGDGPWGRVTMSGSTLFGTTGAGGSNGKGAIFAIVVPEPSSFALLGVGAVAIGIGYWRKRKCVHQTR